MRCARAIRARDPRAGLAYTLESHALLGMGRAEESIETLRTLPADVQRDADHHVSLAVSLQRSRRHEEAIRSFFDALALKMDDALSHFRLGMSFKELGMKAEAAECVRTAIVLGLGSSELAARGQLAFLEREACRWAAADDAMAGLRPAVRALPDDTPVETSPFPHAVLVDDPLEQLKVGASLRAARRQAATGRCRAGRARARRAPAHRLPLGRLPHARDQPADGADARVPRPRALRGDAAVEPARTTTAPMRQRMRRRQRAFRGPARPGLRRDRAARIASSSIDILVDLKGATYDTLMPVLAQRPAPLQVAWLGFPGTTGAPYIDYLIGDRGRDAARRRRALQREDRPDAALLPAERRAPGTAAGRRRGPSGAWPTTRCVLCAFHQSYKISAEVFDTWCALLQRAAADRCSGCCNGTPTCRQPLTAAARERGIAADRLVFAPVLPLEAHLARLACADLYLDAWPCNAHTTAGEALWVGVPVVTVQGRTFAQRVAASLLHTAGLDELVCGRRRRLSRAGARAGRRSGAPGGVARRSSQPERHGSPLFDGAAFARDIESLYQRMWRRAVAGKAPEHLPAERTARADRAD